MNEAVLIIVTAIATLITGAGGQAILRALIDKRKRSAEAQLIEIDAAERLSGIGREMIQQVRDDAIQQIDQSRRWAAERVEESRREVSEARREASEARASAQRAWEAATRAETSAMQAIAELRRFHTAALAPTMTLERLRAMIARGSNGSLANEEV